MASPKTKTPPKYQYKPLPTGMEKPVRLLKVWRDPDTQSIAGQLSFVSLDDPNRPPFTALSYVWDHNPAHQTILLDNRTHLVQSASLYPVLEAICSGDKKNMLNPDAYYWIDAICINQSDNAEKNSQVPLMRALYRSSRRTIVWLGPSTPELDRGMKFFLYLSDKRDDVVAHHHARAKHGDRTLPSYLDHPDDWKALAHLLLHPWWRRVWTLQEFVLPGKVRFLCGPRNSFTKDQFHESMYAQYLVDFGPLNEPEYLPAWGRRRMSQWFGCQREGIRLLALMAYTSDHFVTRAEDRIHGMLGLASQRDDDIAGPLLALGPCSGEEGHTVEVLYSRLVEAFILKRESLDIICFAQLFPNKTILNGEGKRSDARYWTLEDGTVAESKVLPLPSWVPDWRVWRHSFVIPLMVSQGGSRHMGNFRPIKGRRKDHERTFDRFCASGDRLPSAVISDDLRRLTCVGFVVDRVDGLGEVLGAADTSSLARNGRSEETDMLQRMPLVQSTSKANTQGHSSTTTKDTGQNLRLLDEVVRTMVLGHRDRYLCDPPNVPLLRDQLKYLATTLVSTQVLEGLGKHLPLPPVYMGFFKWFRANESFLICGTSLGGLVAVDGDKRDEQPPDGADDSPPRPPPVDFSVGPDDELAARLCETTESLNMGKRLFTTVEGLVGMGPPRAGKEDLVCVLLGCNVPVVLREVRHHSHSEDGQNCAVFEFIGECYVDGYMNGEALEATREEREFVLV